MAKKKTSQAQQKKTSPIEAARKGFESVRDDAIARAEAVGSEIQKIEERGVELFNEAAEQGTRRVNKVLVRGLEVAQEWCRAGSEALQRSTEKMARS